MLGLKSVPGANGGVGFEGVGEERVGDESVGRRARSARVDGCIDPFRRVEQVLAPWDGEVGELFGSSHGED